MRFSIPFFWLALQISVAVLLMGNGSSLMADCYQCQTIKYDLTLTGVGTLEIGGKTFTIEENDPQIRTTLEVEPNSDGEVPFKLTYPDAMNLSAHSGLITLLEFGCKACNVGPYGAITGEGRMVCAYVATPEIPCALVDDMCFGDCEYMSFIVVENPILEGTRKVIADDSSSRDPGEILPPTSRPESPPADHEREDVPTVVSQQMSLGRNSGGRPLGRLKWGLGVNAASVDASQIHLDLAINGGSTVEKSFSGGHRQVLSEAILADITPVDSMDLAKGFVVTAYRAAGLAFPPGDVSIPTPAASAKISRVTVQKTSLTRDAVTVPGIKVETQNEGSGTQDFALYAETNLTGDAGEWIEARGATATRTVRSPLDGGTRTELVEELRRDPDTGDYFVTASRTLEYEQFAWGEEMVSTTEGSGVNTRTSTTSYYTTPAVLAGKVHVQINADGSWSRSVYNETTGDLVATYRPWLDAGGAGALTPAAVAAIPASECEVTEYSESPGFPFTRTTTVKIKGQLMSRLVTTEKTLIDSVTGTPVIEVRTEQFRADGQRVSDDRAGYAQVAGPTGMERGSMVYQLAGTGARTTYQETLVEGVTPTRTSTVTRGTQAHPWGEPFKGTREITVSGADGVISQETLVATGGGQFSSVSLRTYATALVSGELVTTETWDGVVSQSTAVAEDGTTTTADEAGQVTISAEDPLTGVQTTTRVGLAVVDSSVTLHDGADLQTIVRYSPRTTGVGYLQQMERKSGATTLLESEQVYDEFGDLVASKDQMERITTFTYGVRSQGGRLVTETLPGGGTRISAYHRDGRLDSVTGTGVVPEYHSYEITNGCVAETVRLGSANSPRWQRTLVDGTGRTVRSEKPAAGGTGELEWSSQIYNDLGQLVQVLRSGGLAPQLTEYDSAGRPWRQGVDLDLDGALLTGSEDPLVETEELYEQVNGQWWQVQRRTTYLVAGGDAGSRRTGVSRQRLGVGPNSVSESIERGRRTVSTVAVNRSLKKREVATTVPGATVTGVQTYLNGLLFFSRQPADLAQTVFSYKEFDRLAGSKGPEGTVVYTYEDSGKLETETRTGSTADVWVTTYEYIASDQAGAGKVKKVTAPVSPMKVATLASTSYSYDSLGRREGQWGTGAYPILYGYNTYGEMTSLTTYRTSFGDDTKPWDDLSTTPAQTSVTTWVYDDASGRLLGKKDAANQTVAYAYNAAGLLSTRTWARGAVTTYTYDGAGRLVLQDYSDATPDVAYTYYRHGAVRSRTDAAGLHVFDQLDGLGSPSFETVGDAPAGPSLLSGLRFHTLKDEAGRVAGHQGILTPPGVSSPPLVLPGVQYQYDSKGELGQVKSGSRQVDYLRALVSGRKVLTMKRPPYEGHATGFSSQRVTDPVVGIVSMTHINGQASGTSLISPAGGFQSRSRTGLKVDQRDVAPTAVSTSWTYGVDSRGQVISGQKRVGTSGTGTIFKGWDAAYAYDDIGNRMESRFGGLGGTSDPVGSETITYTANALNQYEEIANPRAAYVTGTAAYSTTNPALHTEVVINGQTADRVGVNFVEKLTPSGTGPKWEPLNFELVRDSVTQSFQQHLYVPPVQETLSYDLDGNLTGDGRWTYTWDGENRLVGMTTQAVAETAGVPGLKLTFAYDGVSRRVQKKVEGRMTSSDPWVLRSDTRFVYDRWNMVGEAEYLATAADAPPTFGGGTAGPYWRRTYVWGEDLSGSLQGAGGVGGLLLINRHERGSKPLRTSWATSDLNGNVIGLVESNLKAVYEYDPFGKPMRVSEPEEDLNPFQFSTKYTDTETGLCYYGYRFYDAARGRWINRDPIEERGGVALYQMAGNCAVSQIDSDGRMVLPGTLSDKLPANIIVIVRMLNEGGLALEEAARFLAGVSLSYLLADGVADVSQDLWRYWEKLTPDQKSQSDRYRRGVIDLNLELSRRGCPPVWPVFEDITPKIYKNTVGHIGRFPHHSILHYDGLYAKHPDRARKRRDAQAPIWKMLGDLYKTDPAAALALYDGSLHNIDEFPFASTLEGGAGATANIVPAWENTLQGVALAVFYKLPLWNDKPAVAGSEFEILTVPRVLGIDVGKILKAIQEMQ
ncbi:RHS repeat-associated core domain-containing protein [Verrucomicrobium spinosum]|uniref:RHS repeat-associated core domain-containing protein n=2 Tax=Verrucomicrobium spinosum TaxID=2736 RepID=UPI0001745E04|nr:RHS repeat-associated core domain-containing protein [Verrucomicrobium spinosum]